MSEQDGLAEQAAALGIILSTTQADQFATYEAMLIEWSASRNLTAILDPQQITIRHFLDSLTCRLATGDLNGCTMVDVGTGAGFPGLPLKILCPELDLTLVDSIGKKTEFLQAVVDALQLTDVTVVTARAEELGQDNRHRETYDWAVARSVAELSILAEYLLPLVHVGGHVLAQKGSLYVEEVNSARAAIETLGGAVASTKTVILPSVEQPHALIVIDKLTATDSRYPRRVGVPSKRPL